MAAFNHFAELGQYFVLIIGLEVNLKIVIYFFQQEGDRQDLAQLVRELHTLVVSFDDASDHHQ